MKQRYFYFIIFLSFLFSFTSSGQEKHYYFYQPVPYGSESLYNPISLLFNGGFDTFNMLDREPEWKNVYWDHAATNVWRCITAPAPVINRFGWGKFIGTEIFPTNLKIEESQYVPNVGLHLIGGGMEFRKMSEWYDYHNVPVPYLCGAITCMAYEYLNEVVENGMNYYPNLDCIPDILVFQPLGIFFFSFDNVSKFFSEKFQLNDWSNPIAVSFAPFAIRNSCNMFVAKYPLDSARTKSLFLNFGTFAVLGGSFKTDEEHSVSIAAGLTSKGRRALERRNEIPSNTVILGPMAGIYYDRNNSLLASFIFADTYYMRYRLNTYPGFLSIKGWSPGFFLSVDTNGRSTFGVTVTSLPIGLSHHF
ncbi:MAG TPA: hypothetical protein PK595_00345 [Bacteroidota bacterium]|nr:hypothetical protein [Bacteroidota bacterium]